MAVGGESLQCNLGKDEATLSFLLVNSSILLASYGPLACRTWCVKGLCKYLERFEIWKFYKDKQKSLKVAKFYMSS